MRKFTFAVVAFVFALFVATPATAQDTTSQEIYDFAGFDVKKMLDLFYNALQDGRNYPTMEEFEAAGIQASDIAFVRSHVRRAEIMDRADRLISDTYEKRDLFMNIPMDVGSGGAAGYPSDKFLADVYSMWQYTNLFGSWNHSFFQAPGAWVDAAHRNGTDIMSGIAFFESWTGDGDKTYSAMITQKDAQGQFLYVKPLINCLMFFGADGINYNWEDNSYGNSDIVAFHKALWKYAEEVGFTNYHSAIYTSNSSLYAGNANSLFGTTDSGKTHDLMLNYANGDFSYQIGSSVTAAETAFGTAEGLYTGVWIVGMDRGWSRLNGGDAYDPQGNSKRCGICLWGEHGQSRFMSYNTGDGAFDTQRKYQHLLERGFSGGYRNPATRPAVSDRGNNWEQDGDKLPLSTFAGIATWIPERSAIQGDFHFDTHFTLGNGYFYYYKGKKSYAGSWYNMGAQDLVPTYRWLRYTSNTTNANDKISVDYTHVDAYTGGSCIELTGAATTAGTDIVLYKTGLKVGGTQPYANIAVKTLKEGDALPTNLYLILKKDGSDAWLEFPVGDVAGGSWSEVKLNLAGLAKGDVVNRVGLRVKGSDDKYQMYVGKLELQDETTITPANVENLVAEVKKETKSSMAVKLYWGVDAVAKERANWGLVYNDEANIDHFEILYKVGEDGRAWQVATTSQWAALVPNIDFSSADDQPYIGVRSISSDLKTYSPTVWVKVARAAQNALPEKEEEYGNYGISQMDEQCEGADNARNARFLASVTTTGATQNLNYKNDFVPTQKTIDDKEYPIPDGTQYAKALDHKLIVNQGQTVTINLRGFDSNKVVPLGIKTGEGGPDGLRWCFAGGWIDLNGSGDFDKPLPVERTASEIAGGKTTTDPEGERLFFAGTLRAGTPEFESANGVEYTFKIPEDATPGQSRLRIVFSDAWFAGMFNPVGYHAKGFTIDFSVEIQGTNPGRVVIDTTDKGEADLPEGFEAGTETGVSGVEDAAVSEAVVAGDVINLNNVEKAWIYTADGRLVEFVKGNPTQVNAAQYAAGTYIVKMQYNNVIRSAKVVIK